MSLSGVLGVSPSYTTTDLRGALLSKGSDAKGSWRYVQANGAISQYDAVKIDNDGQAFSITTTISGVEPTAVGIAQIAFADNDYGWVWIGEGGGSGRGIKVNVLADCAADVKLYTTATAGALDDTATDLIAGLTIVSTNGGSTAAVECYSPIVLTTNCQD